MEAQVREIVRCKYRVPKGSLLCPHGYSLHLVENPSKKWCLGCESLEITTTDKPIVYLVKHYTQSLKEQPRVIETKEFSTEKEALEFYYRVKPSRSTWDFWGYPEKKPEVA